MNIINKALLISFSVSFLTFGCDNSTTSSNITPSNNNLSIPDGCVSLLSCDEELNYSDDTLSELNSYHGGTLLRKFEGYYYDDASESLDREFKGKRIEIKSSIRNIMPDRKYDVAVYLEENGTMKIVAVGDENFVNQISSNKFSPMDLLKMNCTGAGVTDDEALFKDCVITEVLSP